MLVSNLIYLLLVVTIGLIIGTGIKLYRIGCKQLILFSVITPILTLIASVLWCTDGSDNSKADRKTITTIIKRIIFCIKEFSTLLTISCYSVVKAQNEIIARNKVKLPSTRVVRIQNKVVLPKKIKLHSTRVIRESTKSYEKEVSNLYHKSCLV